MEIGHLYNKVAPVLTLLMLKGVNTGEIESSSETPGNKNLVLDQTTYQCTHHSVPNTSQETTTRPITPQPPVLPETTKRAKATNEHSDD